jgi:hypothetical protein
LEPIVLKQVRVVINAQTGGQAVIMNVDTLNGLWEEDDLLSLSDALTAVSAYQARHDAYVAACKSNCTC